MAELNNPGFVPQANPDGQVPGGEPQGGEPTPEPQGGEPTPEPQGGEPTPEPKPEPTPVPDPAPKEPSEPVVPEKYEFKFDEGVEVDSEFQEKAVKLFKDKKFTQEEAQEAMKLITDFGKKITQKNEDEFSGLRKEWVQELKDDKEFGGKNYDATVTKAQAILKRFFDYDTAVFLQAFGVGDNPSMAKGLARLFDALGEDKTPSGGLGNIGGEQSLADIMYPNQGKN